MDNSKPPERRDVTGENYAIDPDKREDYLAYVERLQRLESDRKEIGEDIKELMAEAKGVGLDAGAIRRAAKRLRMTEEEREAADEREEQTNLIVAWVNRSK